jgi:hypothetical protein
VVNQNLFLAVHIPSMLKRNCREDVATCMFSHCEMSARSENAMHHTRPHPREENANDFLCLFCNEAQKFFILFYEHCVPSFSGISLSFC